MPRVPCVGLPGLYPTSPPRFSRDNFSSSNYAHEFVLPALVAAATTPRTCACLCGLCLSWQSFLGAAGRPVVYRNADDDDDVSATVPSTKGFSPPVVTITDPALTARAAVPLGALVVAVGGAAACFTAAAWPHTAPVGSVGAGQVLRLDSEEGGVSVGAPTLLVTLRADDEGASGLWAGTLFATFAPTRCGRNFEVPITPLGMVNRW